MAATAAAGIYMHSSEEVYRKVIENGQVCLFFHSPPTKKFIMHLFARNQKTCCNWRAARNVIKGERKTQIV